MPDEAARGVYLQADVLIEQAERQREAVRLQEGGQQLVGVRAEPDRVAHGARGRRRPVLARLLRLRQALQVVQLLRGSKLGFAEITLLKHAPSGSRAPAPPGTGPAGRPAPARRQNRQGCSSLREHVLNTLDVRSVSASVRRSRSLPIKHALYASRPPYQHLLIMDVSSFVKSVARRSQRNLPSRHAW